MRYVLASVAPATLEAWQHALNGLSCLEFRQGAGSVVSDDCDAQIMKFYHAHDRYGGTPEVGRSQVLANTRGDGSPAIIITTPPFTGGPEITNPVELEDRMYCTFSRCFDAVAQLNSINPGIVTKLLIHIEGLGLEEIGREPSIIGLRRALQE